MGFGYYLYEEKNFKVYTQCISNLKTGEILRQKSDMNGLSESEYIYATQVKDGQVVVTEMYSSN